MLVGNVEICSRQKNIQKNYNVCVYNRSNIGEDDKFIKHGDKVENDESELTITIEKLQNSLHKLNSGKATGIDDIPTELLKHLGTKQKTI